mgnify:CR=1 FL=1
MIECVVLGSCYSTIVYIVVIVVVVIVVIVVVVVVVIMVVIIFVSYFGGYCRLSDGVAVFVVT